MKGGRSYTPGELAPGGMEMVANQTERKRWTNPGMVESWPKREIFTDRVTEYLLAAADLRPGDKVLDIGCGGGKTTLAAAGLVAPDGKAVGVDISGVMLGLATRRAKEAKTKGVRFTEGDMQVDRVGGGPFDVAISQFGVMFFEEPVAAFGNVLKHLRRGGRFVFACWQGPELNKWFLGPAMAPFAPPPSPPAPGKSPTGPFALADSRRTRGLLQEAGFQDVTRFPRRLIVRAPDYAVGDEAMISFLGVPKAREKEALAALEKHLARFRAPDGMSRYELNFQVFTAQRPLN